MIEKTSSENILLSIVIPCYNSANTIGTLIDHLLVEENGLYEIIVVNDGSVDETEKIVHLFGDRIKLINQSNLGVSQARNTGIINSRGKYIWFIDSDDDIKQGSVKYIIDKLNNCSIVNDVIGFGYETRNNGKVKDYVFKEYDKKTMLGEKVYKDFLNKKISFHVCSFVINKHFIISNKLFFENSIPIGEDIVFIMRILAKAGYISYYAKKIYIYQINELSVMKGYMSYSKKQFNSFVFICKEGYQQMRENMKLKREYLFFLTCSYVSNLFRYLKSDIIDDEITYKFVKYSYLLKTQYAFGEMKRFMLFKLLSFVPITWILSKKYIWK